MKKEKTFAESVLNNIIEIRDTYDVKDLLIKKNVKGNLSDYLKELDEEQLNILLRCYFRDEKIFDKDIKDRLRSLEKKIKENFVTVIASMPYSQIVMMEDFIKGKEDGKISDLFIYCAYVFLCVDENQVKYRVPDDLKDLFLKNITTEDKQIAIQAELLTRLFSMSFSLGLIREDLVFSGFDIDIDNIIDKRKFLKDIEDAVDTKIINNEKYLWSKDFIYNDEFATNIENRIYIKRGTKTYAEYMLKMTLFTDRINSILKLNPTEALKVVMEKVLLKQRKPSLIVDDFVNNYDLTVEESEEIVDIINDNYYEIRFWDNGGRTEEEVRALDLVLKGKPKKNTLEECLKQLTNKGLDQLNACYECTDKEKLKKIIIDDVFMSIEDYFSNEEDVAEVLECNNKIYNGNLDITSFILDGYAYLYKDNEDFKVIIPKELEEILEETEFEDYSYYDDDEEEEIEKLDKEDIIFLYMIYNGVLEKKTLQKLLKNNHNIDCSIKELDKMIDYLEFFTNENYYYLYDGMEDIIEEILLPVKHGFKKYKIINNSCDDVLDVIDDFKSDIYSYLNKYSYDEENLETAAISLLYLININLVNEELVRDSLKVSNFNIKNADCKNIIKIINKYKNDIPIWVFNGYTKKELVNVTKSNKVGRNDPCPCGSGKKYKNCCGK